MLEHYNNTKTRILELWAELIKLNDAIYDCVEKLECEEWKKAEILANSNYLCELLQQIGNLNKELVSIRTAIYGQLDQ